MIVANAAVDTMSFHSFRFFFVLADFCDRIHEVLMMIIFTLFKIRFMATPTDIFLSLLEIRQHNLNVHTCLCTLYTCLVIQPVPGCG